MRILLTFLHPEPSGVELARRSVPRDQLIILATPSQVASARVLQAQEAATTALESLKPRIVPVEPHDPTGALQTIETVLEQLARDEVTFNIAAEHPPLTHAAFLACLRLGRSAHFFLHNRVEQLPILRGYRLVETFEPDEAAMMLTLSRDSLVSKAAKGTRQILVDRMLSSLKQKGVVRLVRSPEGIRAAFTPEGGYYLEQLEATPSSVGLPAPRGSAAGPSPVRLLKPSTRVDWPAMLATRPRRTPPQRGPSR